MEEHFNLKVVCIDNSKYPYLEINKVYKSKQIYYHKESINELDNEERMFHTEVTKFPITPVDWESNMLYIEGFSNLEWFETKYFITLDQWRNKQLEKLL